MLMEDMFTWTEHWRMPDKRIVKYLQKKNADEAA